MSELSNCPFCSNKAYVQATVWDDCGPDSYRVVCETDDCVEGSYFNAAASAIAAWNRRAALGSDSAFDIALDALDAYQRNWDTGADFPYAESERIAMESAVEAVRDALNDARATHPTK